MRAHEPILTVSLHASMFVINTNTHGLVQFGLRQCFLLKTGHLELRIPKSGA
jgi:hypothetical protein